MSQGHFTKIITTRCQSEKEALNYILHMSDLLPKLVKDYHEFVI